MKDRKEERPQIAISACLMGQKVRFDGSHKRSSFCQNDLKPHVDFHLVCPEVEIGMPIPRPAIHLVDIGSKDQPNLRAIGTKDKDPHNPSIDVSDDLYRYGVEKGQQMQNLDGYIFMQKSPSCGVFSTKRYLPNGFSDGMVSGLYVQGFRSVQPLLPVEEAGRLNDAGLRDNFLIRVYAWHNWRTQVQANLDKKQLIQFHARHKYLLMAHSVEGYRQLGRLLSDLKKDSLENIALQYITGFMLALAKPASRKRNANALMHVCGYLKRFLDHHDRVKLRELIERYRVGQLPIVVPFTMIQHHLDKHLSDDSYVRKQAYLSPYPQTLGVRNLI